MNPHLTGRGRWGLGAALAFLAAGAVAEQPLLLVIGQVQIAVLAVSFMLCVVAALALDRRFVRVEISNGPVGDEFRSTGLAVGESVQVDIVVTNHSWLPLYGLRVQAYGMAGIEFSDIDRRFHLPPGARVCAPLSVEFARCGCWGMQGVDVSMADPLGLLAVRDYLPCVHAFECVPDRDLADQRQSLNLGSLARQPGGKHAVRQAGAGTVVRELREYQSGDPLRHVAWKATARNRRLIARDFEGEDNLSMYLLLDMSTSMRGGQWRGQKLDAAISAVAELADRVLASHDRVGLMTFDEKLYGHIPPDASPSQAGRLMRHLMGLTSVVDADLTEWSDRELIGHIADYLVVQERLDFRRATGDDEAGEVNRALLNRWLASVIDDERAKYDAPIFHEGIVDDQPSLARQFAQLRGIDVPYRVEARLGLKERGLNEAIEHIVEVVGDSQWVVVITDLCGIMNTDTVTRAIRLAQIRGHTLQFVVPFTPAFYDDDAGAPERYQIIRQLFAVRERDERLEVVDYLRSMGARVTFMKPGQSAIDLVIHG